MSPDISADIRVKEVRPVQTQLIRLREHNTGKKNNDVIFLKSILLKN